MTVYHRAYLFDADRCRDVLLPLIRELVAGRPKSLQDKATELGTTNTEVWGLLRDFRLHLNDLGHEDEEFDTQDQRIRYWLMIVFAHFWRPLETPRNYARTVRDAILSVEDDPQFVELLTIGKPVDSLISDQQLGRRVESGKELTSWCKLGLMGWLDRSDVDAQRRRLNSLQVHFLHNHKSPHNTAYLAAIRLMTRASQEASGLFMAISD